MTDKPETTPEESGSPIQETLRQLDRRLTDVTNLLRQQRDMLRQRGVNLPSGALDSMRTLKKHLDNLKVGALNSQMELRSLRALAANAALINSSQTTGEVLNQVMDTVIALTGAEHGYIVLKNRDTGELEFTVARGIEQSQLDGSKALVVSRSIVNRVADTGQPVLTDNASADSQFSGSESVVGFALRSIMAVPLKLREEVIGVVYCDNRFMVALFKPTDLEILNAFAAQAAVAIENARLFEAARRSVQDVSALRDRMRNIFTSVASGIITTDHEGRILIHNAAAGEMLNREDLRGELLTDAFPPVDDAFQNALVTARAGGSARPFRLTPEVGGLGSRIWNVNVSPLLDAAGSTQGMAIVLDDVTEQTARETQLAEVRRYLPLALVENIKNVEEIDVRGQEREITALFADVRGFTTFSEKLQPEELMTVINKYLSLASDAINLYEGIVDKYMGDAVTGLYNTQLNPQPDHAARAVQSALALVMDLHASEVMPENERLFYGIGIHTGDAVLGNVGGKERKEFAAMGDATIVCKYLQEQAGPGEIIISQATYDLVEDLFECEPAEVKREKKGYEHVVFYRVIKRKKGGLSPFVDQELLDLLGDLNA